MSLTLSLFQSRGKQAHQSLNSLIQSHLPFNYNPHRFALQFQLIKATNNTELPHSLLAIIHYMEPQWT